MLPRTWRGLALLAAAALTTASFVVPASASSQSAVQGITDDEIFVVQLVPDFDALKARGINVGDLSNADQVKRFQASADEFGPIHGRRIVTKAVGWDPLDPTAYDRACTTAVVDNKPFLVINGGGYRDSAIPCVTVDHDTPFFGADVAFAALQKESGKNLVMLGLPPEVNAATAVQLLAKTGRIPKSAKIGIVSSNVLGIKAAADTLEKELTKRGYDVVDKVEVNGLSSDASLIQREVAQAATTFQAHGIDTVFNVQALTLFGAFYTEAARSNYKPNVYAIDGQANTCHFNAANRAPAEAAGLVCITTQDSKAAADAKGVRPDNAFEAECRTTFEAARGFETSPNGPTGGRTVTGVRYNEDFAPAECTIAALLLPALKKAGKNPTWEKVQKNLMATTQAPAAYLSNGEGGFGPKKPYFANQVHFVKLTKADDTTPKDAAGTYNGCPIPVHCWVPFTVDGEEWFPVSTK